MELTIPSKVGDQIKEEEKYQRKKTILILLLVILITGICSTAEAVTNWLSGYSHRVKIPVNATVAGAQTNYQMQIVLYSTSGFNFPGNICLNDNLQDTTDFNDIRFTTSDGTTLKDFWIQKVEDIAGGRKATVYVKLNTPAFGRTDYYLYYGKFGDTSVSNYDNTFTKDYGECGLAGLWSMDVSPGSELLTDGGLETWDSSTDLTNWTENGTSAGIREITQDLTVKYAGLYSAKLSAIGSDGTADFGIHQDITTVNNEAYQVSFYQKYSYRTKGTLKIEAYDNTHSVSLVSQSITAASTGFSFISFRFTSTNTTNVRIKVYLNDETTGTAYIDALSVKSSSTILDDSSGNSNNGIIYGASRTDTDGGQWDGRSDVVFSTGSALQFDGVNDYVDAGNAASLNFGTNDFTIELWAKAAGGTSARGIVNKGGWGSIGYSIQQAYSPANQYFFVVKDSVGYKYVFLPLYETWGWTHIVGIKKSNHLEAWVNGVKVGTYNGTIGSLSNPNKKFEVGRGAEFTILTATSTMSASTTGHYLLVKFLVITFAVSMLLLRQIGQIREPRKLATS